MSCAERVGVTRMGEDELMNRRLLRAALNLFIADRSDDAACGEL